jgi:hypothetical protein
MFPPGIDWVEIKIPCLGLLDTHVAFFAASWLPRAYLKLHIPHPPAYQ